jgi:hypothetical protein
VPTGTSSFTARRTAPAAAPAAAAPVAALPATTKPDASSALSDYRQLLGTQLAKLLDAAEAVGGQVLAATRILAEGFQREAAVVEAIGVCQVRRQPNRLSFGSSQLPPDPLRLVDLCTASL